LWRIGKSTDSPIHSARKPWQQVSKLLTRGSILGAIAHRYKLMQETFVKKTSTCFQPSARRYAICGLQGPVVHANMKFNEYCCELYAIRLRKGRAEQGRKEIAMESPWNCRIATMLMSLVLLGVPPLAFAAVVQYDLQFETSGQSLWDTGDAYTLNETKFLGAEWNDQNVSIDAIAGDETNNVINPLRLTYDAAFATCNLAFSASACINGQSARVGVPALGSRPSVRSCGKYAVACGIARLADLGKRATYDAAFALCRKGFSASVCRNGQSFRAPVLALGTAPPQYLNVDTRTGFALNGTSDGRVGLELGVKIDSGSVDARVSYEVAMEIPDTLLLDKADAIYFNPTSALAGNNTLATSFSSLSMSVDAVMELSGGVDAEGCILLTGCVTGGSTFAINERASVLSFNEDGQGGILLLGQTPSDLGVDPLLNGFPLDLDIAGLATATLHLPQPDASGGLDSASQTLKATGQDDLFDLTLDLDNIVATAAGVPGLFGTSVDIPVLGSVGYDIINVEMGPTVDLKQEFELDPTLFVSLVFDQAVEIGGQIVTSLVTAWDQLPAIKFINDVTRITPTFFVQADLFNRTLLDFDLAFGIDLLQIYYDFGLLGDGSAGIGNVLSKSIDLFDSPDFYSKLFELKGFNLQIGDSFVIDFTNGSRGPQSTLAQSAVNPIVLAANPNTVPEPGAALLVLLALGVLALLRARTPLPAAHACAA
jgi:hypothetical protein